MLSQDQSITPPTTSLYPRFTSVYIPVSTNSVQRQDLIIPPQASQQNVHSAKQWSGGETDQYLAETLSSLSSEWIFWLLQHARDQSAVILCYNEVKSSEVVMIFSSSQSTPPVVQQEDQNKEFSVVFSKDMWLSNRNRKRGDFEERKQASYTQAHNKLPLTVVFDEKQRCK